MPALPSTLTHFHPTEDAPVLAYLDPHGVATLILNRPEKRNAFDAEMIVGMQHYLEIFASYDELRLLIFKAQGNHFSAGADLNWMRSMADNSYPENLDDARQLAELMHQLDTFPVPTIITVQGFAIGGAVGIICCCDIALGDESCRLALSEVKVGLIPATIMPYVNRTLGQRQTRRYSLTAEWISAKKAEELGLFHQITATPEERENSLASLKQKLMQNSPQALRAVKQLCAYNYAHPLDDSLRQHTSDLIAQIRTSPEGQEGLAAFLEQRDPNWRAQ
ncbi:hypothetical protein ABT56_11975 [Photobacterium aquae]|uniref:Gamma-carboxygeranoyl-CoA hydratase n=1 Tax=Photobacterium aquae TaxID=1195763 RepID=A0A0J1H0R2_9GAMM|nr:enoyl-CoA hydratase-related protein [Photobacterium aquae]KLV05425.1 hypothetical protein ABT56_11975 [Photobacterium aquae]